MTTLRFTVTAQDTAIALGSGDVPVLGTPRLLAWMEQASARAAAHALDASCTSVGVEVRVRHRRASAVGAVIEVQAVEERPVEVQPVEVQPVEVRPVEMRPVEMQAVEMQAVEVRAREGARLEFTVVARELPPGGSAQGGPGAAAREVADGRIVRAVVDRAAFLSRLGRPTEAAGP